MNEQKQLTKEEVRKEILERMRLETLEKQIRNEVMLDALREERIKSKVGGDTELTLVKNIRDRETLTIQLEEDLKLIEGKLNES